MKRVRKIVVRGCKWQGDIVKAFTNCSIGYAIAKNGQRFDWNHVDNYNNCNRDSYIGPLVWNSTSIDDRKWPTEQEIKDFYCYVNNTEWVYAETHTLRSDRHFIFKEGLLTLDFSEDGSIFFAQGYPEMFKEYCPEIFYANQVQCSPFYFGVAFMNSLWEQHQLRAIPSFEEAEKITAAFIKKFSYHPHESFHYLDGSLNEDRLEYTLKKIDKNLDKELIISKGKPSWQDYLIKVRGINELMNVLPWTNNQIIEIKKWCTDYWPQYEQFLNAFCEYRKDFPHNKSYFFDPEKDTHPIFSFSSECFTSLTHTEIRDLATGKSLKDKAPKKKNLQKEYIISVVKATSKKGIDGYNVTYHSEMGERVVFYLESTLPSEARNLKA